MLILIHLSSKLSCSLQAGEGSHIPSRMASWRFKQVVLKPYVSDPQYVQIPFCFLAVDT